MTTSDEIIFARRVRLLELAEELGNIAAACRQLGLSRTRFYEWKKLAENYGIEALWPKDRRRPAQPNETPTHVIADLMALVVIEPTIGCRQFADRLCELGFKISKSTVQRILVDHGLGRRRQRVSRAAAIAMLSGLITDPVTEADAEPFGFCHWAARPGDLVALDSFYIGHLKGVGKVYQLTAIDTCTRWAIVKLIIGPGTTADTSVASASRSVVCSPTTDPNTRVCCFASTWPRPVWVMCASRPGPRTTTPCANDSRARCSKSAGDQRFIAVTSPRSVSSSPKPTRG